jgi:exopolysaccharide biosynthesis polyprenyl glycosylphosphotransferase
MSAARFAAVSWVAVCLLVDVLSSAGAAAISLLDPNVPRMPFWAVADAALTLVLLGATGVYSQRRLALSMFGDCGPVVKATTFAAMLILTAQTASDVVDPGRNVVREWIYLSAFLIAGRIGVNWAQIQARKSGSGQRRTLIVGAGSVGQTIAARLLDQPQLGRRPIGFLDKDPLVESPAATDLPVLGASWDLERVVAEHEIDEVIVSFSRAPNHVLLNVIRRCARDGVAVSLVPRLFEKVPRRIHVEHLGGLPLVELSPPHPLGVRFFMKHAADRIVVVLLSPLIGLVMAIVALAILATSGRPIFFRQRRVGRDGREFEMLKFRTMAAAPGGTEYTPEAGLAPGGVEGVDRRTRLGTLLRRTSLDELPQMLNVLRGEMSLVGPRPERPAFVRTFNDTVYAYGDRHRVKSGVTGWAQVNGLRGNTSIRSRAELDNYYIENWSLSLDLRILLMTVRAVFRQRDVV